MLDMLKEITLTGAWIWAFLSFGLPLILVVFAAFASGFSDGAIFSWHGRMGRLSYFLNQILAMAISVAGVFILVFSFQHKYMVIGALGGVLVVGTIFRSLAIGARRLHDFNLPGWPMILLVVFGLLFGSYDIAQAIQTFLCIALWVIPGTKDRNQYGERQEERFYL